MTPARVFVVAPTPMVRAGLRSMLEAAGVGVVGEAGSPAGPVLEPSLSDAVVLLVADEGSASKLRDLSLRGWGIVPSDAPTEELGAAVAAAAQGLTVLPKALAEQLLAEPAVAEELSEPPTAREREVLGLLGQGFSNKMIARELHISEHTVKFHISSLYAKLGVSNRAEAVSRGARHGLISL